MTADQVQRFVFEGFGYQCRIVENPAPRTEPIIVVGGAFQNMYSYRRLEGPWAEAATVISVDLPGSGASDSLPATYGFDFLSGVLADLLDRLGLGKVNLYAISYGVPVAYHLAQEHPDRVARLALMGAAPLYPPEGLQGLRAMADALASADADDYARRSVEALMAPADRPVRNRAAVTRLLARDMAAITGAAFDRHLASTRRVIDWQGFPPGGITGIPALCFTGEHDTLTRPDLGREAASTIEGSVFALVRETDHLPALERHREVSQLLLRFFTGKSLEALDFLTPLEHPSRPLLAATRSSR
ncbi:alpha/beta fold hydrolase [Streptomyces stackebrandtii]|uniref:alpha/beta fold hydrolase n=1 Tax=Streptomyces stackebrandtii TaxID=3051177 RepID=UPI0028DB9C5B|nr:alpha/beta hydrolase [Streptomyces sp. DSM 40976]